MNKRNSLYGIIGVAAFVIGGIVARTKAIETAETVENFFAKKTEPAPID